MIEVYVNFVGVSRYVLGASVFSLNIKPTASFTYE